MSRVRSVYLSRLRRAFLLRVHPDRFRKYQGHIQESQGCLVKAMASRLGDADFIAWQQKSTPHRCGADTSSTRSQHQRQIYGEHCYSVEKRDGSLLHLKISLQGSVQSIIRSMEEALRQVGATLPGRPDNYDDEQDATSSPHDHHARTTDFPWEQSVPSTHEDDQGHHHYDHDQFNIMSRRGRDLGLFLERMNPLEIAARRLSRTDAQAAALEVRRRFQFQSVDATSLGWSSSSVAVLLQRLLQLHDEHAEKLCVRSFYPLRLVFTPDDFHDALDMYGGLIRLNPGQTPIQWLETLRLVDDAKIEVIRMNRAQLADKLRIVEEALGVKLRKGHSCSSREYQKFVECIWDGLDGITAGCDLIRVEDAGSDQHALVATPIIGTVESSQVCRRPAVTSEGTIRLGAGMSDLQVRDSIRALGIRARERSLQDQMEQQSCHDAIHKLQASLGVQRVYRAGVVSQGEFLESLTRLLKTVDATRRRTQEMDMKHLTGNSLGIAGNGHYCHLADDGSIIIPHNWC